MRFLIIDSVRDASEALARQLISSGHQATAACDPVTALGLACALNPDAILVDLVVRDLETLIGQIRNYTPCKSTPLVAIGSYGDPGASRLAPFFAYYMKPVDADDLIRRLNDSKEGPS